MKHDVAVIGCGLIGSVMAVALARRGLRVALLERGTIQTDYVEQQDGRTIALAHGSRLIFENLGLWQTLAENAEPITDIRVVDEFSTAHVHYDHRDVGDEPFGFIVEQEWMRHTFNSAVRVQENIEIVEEAEVTSIDTSDACATIHINEKDDVTMPLVLACDGRFSGIRDMLGIGYKAMAYEQSAIVVRIKHSLPHNGVALERFLPQGPFAVLPLRGGHHSGVVWTEGNMQAKHLMEQDEAVFLAALKEALGGYLGKVELDGKRFSYPLQLTVTEDVVAPRAALIGDSAHAIHPIAGQGVNLGYRDVAAMEELVVEYMKLGLDIGAPQLLEAYKQRRSLDVKSMTAATDGINRLFSTHNPAARVARRIGLRAVEASPTIKHRFMMHAMGMSGELPPLMHRKEAA